MTFSWVRTTSVSDLTQQGSTLLGKLNGGQTYIRVHFRWGFYGDTPDIRSPFDIQDNIITLGLVTTIGDGTETPPAARTASNDAAPPTQRWIYWETRGLTPSVISPDAGLMIWRDVGSTEPTDTKGQVLATGLPGGDTLNLWASWQMPFAWDTYGSARVWLGASVLYKTP